MDTFCIQFFFRKDIKKTPKIKLNHSKMRNFFKINVHNNNMNKKETIKKIIIGILAGFISGLFSTGGGLILVPAFTYLLKLDTVEARATSIMCILPMVLTTSFFYARNKYIDWKLGFLCATRRSNRKLYRI